jgi:hypothetical protein
VPDIDAILKYVLYLSVSTVKYGTNTRSRPAITVRYACPDAESGDTGEMYGRHLPIESRRFASSRPLS